MATIWLKVTPQFRAGFDDSNVLDQFSNVRQSLGPYAFDLSLPLFWDAGGFSIPSFYKPLGTTTPIGNPVVWIAYVGPDLFSDYAYAFADAASYSIDRPAEQAPGLQVVYSITGAVDDYHEVISYPYWWQEVSVIALFTDGRDQVSFLELKPDQIDSINKGAVLYHAGKGDDTVMLPNLDKAQLTNSVLWNFATPFNGGNGNDTITGGSGDDIINGGEGSDTVKFNGPSWDYSIKAGSGGGVVVKDLNWASDTNAKGIDDGADILSGVEYIQFSNGLFPVAATKVVLDFDTPIDRTWRLNGAGDNWVEIPVASPLNESFLSEAVDRAKIIADVQMIFDRSEVPVLVVTPDSLAPGEKALRVLFGPPPPTLTSGENRGGTLQGVAYDIMPNSFLSGLATVGISIDRFDIRKDGSVAVFLDASDPELSETIAHEVAHGFGIRHVNPYIGSGIEVEDYAPSLEPIFTGIKTNIVEQPIDGQPPQGGTHNPVFHLLKYLVKDEKFPEAGFAPGSWDEGALSFLGVSVRFDGINRELTGLTVRTDVSTTSADVGASGVGDIGIGMLVDPSLVDGETVSFALTAGVGIFIEGSIAGVSGNTIGLGIEGLTEPVFLLRPGALGTTQSGGVYEIGPDGKVVGRLGNFNLTVTQNVTVGSDGVVIAGNLPPVLTDDVIVTGEDLTSSVLLLANDREPDGTPLVVSAVNGSPANVSTEVALVSGALVTVSANGSATYDPNGAFDWLREGQAASDSFTYNATDGNQEGAPATANITIIGSNDVASISGHLSGRVAEDGNLIASGVLYVSDPDRGEAVFQTPASLAGTFGTFAFNSTSGEWVYTLSNTSDAVQALKTGDIRTETLTVTSGDGTASQTINVTVEGVDDAVIGNVILGQAGQLRLNGTADADIIIPDPSNRWIDAKAGDDIIILDPVGRFHIAYINGGGGRDTLDLSHLTSDANLNLTGLATGSQLGIKVLSSIENVVGGAGNDRLVGTASANRIEGGGGDDQLTGGKGLDTFVFKPGFGNDRITDFDDNPNGGQDLIELAKLGINEDNFADHVTIADIGRDVLVTIDNDPDQTILLSGIQSATTVSVDDFRFF